MNSRPLLLLPVSIGALAALALWHEVPDRTMIDGLTGEILGVLLPLDTEYANDYSHSGFNKIRLGMTENEVLVILGEPLVRWQPHKNTRYAHKAHCVGSQYSRSPTSTNYRLRQVYMDRGVVAEKIGYFFAD